MKRPYFREALMLCRSFLVLGGCIVMQAPLYVIDSHSASSFEGLFGVSILHLLTSFSSSASSIRLVPFRILS